VDVVGSDVGGTCIMDVRNSQYNSKYCH
jgi:hypothetical protein